MKSFLGGALGQQSLFFKQKIILIDEIDNISGISDRGCLSALSKALENSRFPVILTANDPFDSKFKSIRDVSQNIEFSELNPIIISHALKWVCEQENIEAEERAIQSISHRSAGDLRSALIDLQSLVFNDQNKKKLTLNSVSTLSDRKRTETIMNALTRVFKSSSVQTALSAMDDIDVDVRDIFSWIDENLPSEYINHKDLARAYEKLSRADIFQKRISKNQHWRFLAYIMDLLTAGISSSKENKNSLFVQYQQSKRGLKIWMSRNKLAKREAIIDKLAKITHLSQKKAREEMFFVINTLKAEVKANKPLLIKELELNDEEIEWLRKS
jgi:replication factor C large subunit